MPSSLSAVGLLELGFVGLVPGKVTLPAPPTRAKPDECSLGGTGCQVLAVAWLLQQRGVADWLMARLLVHLLSQTFMWQIARGGFDATLHV